MEEERQAEAVMQPDCLHACSPLTDSLLLLRCRPDASRTHGFTLKEALVFLPRSGVHLCVCVCAVCVCVCAQHVNYAHQRAGIANLTG